jgi:hypothetical protein
MNRPHRRCTAFQTFFRILPLAFPAGGDRLYAISTLNEYMFA